MKKKTNNSVKKTILIVLIILVVGLLLFLGYKEAFTGRAIKILEDNAPPSSEDECVGDGLTATTRCNGDNIERQFHSCYGYNYEAQQCTCHYTWVLDEYCGLGLTCSESECVLTDLEIVVKTERNIYFVNEIVRLTSE